MRTWLKNKYIAMQLLVAAFQRHDLDEAMTQLDILLGGNGEDNT